MKYIFHHSIFQSILLVFVGSVLYSASLDNWFSEFAGDDDWMVYENRYVFSLSLENIKIYFTNFYKGQYSPINTLAYGVIYHFFGIDPTYFHGFSLILHLANVLFVLYFLRQLIILRGKDILKDGSEADYTLVPFFTGLLFLIHPMQVESVVWVSASKVLLYAFFFLSALVFYLRYIATCHRGYYLLSIVIFILSFGAKEQTVVLPVVLILIDWYLGRDLKDRKVVLEKLPFFLLSIGFSVISMAAQHTGFSYKLENEYYPLIDRFFLASYAFTEYIFKLLVPFKLSAWYKFPMAPGEAVPVKYYFYPVLILFFGYYLWQFWIERKYWILFGFTFFTINIMLTLHILPMARGLLMADRYVYVGSIGIFYILSIYMLSVYQQNKLKSRRRMMLSAIIIYLTGLGGYSFWYIDHWNII